MFLVLSDSDHIIDDPTVVLRPCALGLDNFDKTFKRHSIKLNSRPATFPPKLFALAFIQAGKRVHHHSQSSLPMFNHVKRGNTLKFDFRTQKTPNRPAYCLQNVRTIVMIH